MEKVSLKQGKILLKFFLECSGNNSVNLHSMAVEVSDTFRSSWDVKVWAYFEDNNY